MAAATREAGTGFQKESGLMVYAISYHPSGHSYPMAEVLEGNTGEVELEDMTPDGGVGLQIMRAFSGRRVVPASVPKVIRWMSKRKLQDYEASWIHSVSPRLRDLIEEIEPRVHQFLPVEFVARDRSPLTTRWFWQVCNRVDSVHRGLTRWSMSDNGAIWLKQLDPGAEFVFDLHKIGTSKFWHDKHTGAGTFITNDVRGRIEAGKITGLRYHHYREV